MSSTGADQDGHGGAGFHGPRAWALSTVAGIALGVLLALLVPAPRAPETPHRDTGDAPTVVQTRADGERLIRLPDGTAVPAADADAGRREGRPHAETSHAAPAVPAWLCAPFVLLLLGIALMPFIGERFWHRHYPDISFFLGSLVAAYYLAAFGGYGRHAVLHVAVEYYAFIALVAGLYVVSGGVLLNVRGRGTPLRNTALLAAGAVLANIVGTTGASVLLIRPYLRMNQGRLRALHAVFFIFVVSNCGGCLTPIGDPPLYLGYLKGVPFFWTLAHLWPMWLLVNGMLLAMFFVFDSRVPAAGPAVIDREAGPGSFDPGRPAPMITGYRSVALLGLVVAGVFVDPMLQRYAGIEGVPVGATFQILVAALAYAVTPASVRRANAFTFGPVREVGFLFVGIFLTMAPALAYLSSNAASLGLESPTQYYFVTGGLSAVLDNAPTYLSFLQINFGVIHLPLTAEGIRDFLASDFIVTHGDGGSVGFSGGLQLEAISLGAVFFGAMTYIGNGPNFMVKSIVDGSRDRHGLRMPSFFGYLAWSVALLLPVLVVNWLVFIR